MMQSQQDLNRALGFDLSPEQWSAVSAELRPAVIVAGAGSGKTTSMAARVAWLVGSGQIEADRILGLTFTTKATAELMSSIRSSLSRVAAETEAEPVVQTYHAFAARIVAEHGIRIGREPRLTVMTEAMRSSLAYRLVCRTDLPLRDLEASPTTVTERLLHFDDELVEVDITPQQVIDFDAECIARLDGFAKLPAEGRKMRGTALKRQLLAQLVQQWRELKAERDLIDFADQIRLALEIVRRYPHVAQEVRSNFDVVLLDEYQDTSISQRHLLQALFEGGHAITAVGDPCQAIYGWRGASVQNIESFHGDFGADAQTPRYPLSVNRRSGSNILHVANDIAADLRAVHTGVTALEPVPHRGSGEVRCALFETSADEVAWITADIVERGQDPSVRWKDIAVLASTRDTVAAIEQSLRGVGIPTQNFGAAALLDQPVVVELRSMLEVLHEATANPSMIRILTNPRWAIGPTDLAALGHRARELAGYHDHQRPADIAAALQRAVEGAEPVEAVSLSEALADLGDSQRYSSEGYRRMTQCAQQIAHLRRSASDPIPELIMRVLDVTGLQVELALPDPTVDAQRAADQVGQRQRAVRSFIALANDLAQFGEVSLGAFLASLREAERMDITLPLDQVADADAVQLLTMHKAKGLEFGHVYTPFLSERVFPSGAGRGSWVTDWGYVPWPIREDCPPPLRAYLPQDEPRAKDFTAYKDVLHSLEELENRRLAYVAMTRAQESLTMTGHWWGPSQAKLRGPHPYLQSVRAACIDGYGDVVQWISQEEIAEVNPSLVNGPMSVPWPVPVDEEAWQRMQQAVAQVEAAPVVSEFTGPARRWRRAADVLLEELRIRRSNHRQVRLPDAVSASLWMRAQTHPGEVAATLARPMPHPPSRAAQRGTEVHAWIEARFGQQSLIDPFDLPGAADDDITSDAAVRALQEAFDASEFAHRQPVATERPFALMLDGRVVRGRIDAVFFDGDRYDVIDWKTGVHHDPLQLAIYRAAWAQIVGVSPEEVDAAFFVIGPNELIRPERLPDLPGLGALER